MESPASVHPADETLVSYGLGKLDDTLTESVGKHLEECDPCRRRVAELSSDSFLGRLQGARPEIDKPDPKSPQESKPAAPKADRPKTLAESVPPAADGRDSKQH